jgi:hypothetical protein
MITEFSHADDYPEISYLPAIVHPRAAVDPVRRAAAHPSRRPPARLPPSSHPRPDRLRQAHSGPGVRLRLPTHRRPQLLGDPGGDPFVAAAAQRGRRAAAPGRAGRLRPTIRLGGGAPERGRLHHQGALRWPGRRTQPDRPPQARTQALGGYRDGWHPAGGGGGPGQPPRRRAGDRVLAGAGPCGHHPVTCSVRSGPG